MHILLLWIIDGGYKLWFNYWDIFKLAIYWLDYLIDVQGLRTREPIRRDGKVWTSIDYSDYSQCY